MTDEPIDLAPFDLLTQKEQWSHLQQYHLARHLNYYATSKSRKADYEAMHHKSHLEDVHVRTEHTHTAVAPQSGSTKPFDPSRPINTTQGRALKDLVDNDFAALRAEIDQFATDMAKAKREELTKEWNDKGANASAFQVEAQRIINDCRVAIDRLIAEARSKGVTLEVNEPYNGGSVKSRVDGLKQAIHSAEAEIEADRRRAMNAHERARLTAQRKVLMARVTEEGLKLLEEIPDARQLMVQAQQERVPQELSAAAYADDEY